MDGTHISYTLDADGRRYFTNADLAQMVEQGLIDPDDRWELIRGEWFDMPSESYEHMDVRTQLYTELILQLGRRADLRVNTEGSFFFSQDTELRPDLAIYRADVGTNEMAGTDLFLVAEVMKSSRRRDMDLKRPVYAAVGVPELWLIDLDEETITVCRDPRDGTYQDTAVHGADDPVRALAFPEIELTLEMLRGRTGKGA